VSLIEKLKKNSTIKDTAVLSKSKFFMESEDIPTMIPALNIALSARLDAGIEAGLTQWCGESKRFKSTFCLLMAKTYLDKYPEAVLLFYDSEFGTPQPYFEKIGIDMNRVLHVPIPNIEMLKNDVVKQLETIERGEKVFIVVDSIGNLASKKEVDDALADKSVQDMSRPKQLKSLFRMITPYLNIKNIPMHVVNHVYKTLELYGKDVVSGGQGSYLSADNIYIIGRQQEKEGTDIVGWNFIINVEKSRLVKEKSKIPITISYEGGINRYSGLLDIALELGFVTKPSNGWYSRVNIETGEVEEKKFRSKDTNTKEFWEDILNSEKFNKEIYDKYSISSRVLMDDSFIHDSSNVEEVDIEPIKEMDDI